MDRFLHVYKQIKLSWKKYSIILMSLFGQSQGSQISTFNVSTFLYSTYVTAYVPHCTEYLKVNITLF